MKVSFIVTVYNKGKMQIQNCINSIINQKKTNLEYEIILINDGSSLEESNNSCKELSNKYTQIKYINFKKNCGTALSRQKGIESSTGDYLCFVDSDDILTPNYLSTLEVEFYKNVDMIVFNRKKNKLHSISISFDEFKKYKKYLCEWTQAFCSVSSEFLRKNNIKYIPDNYDIVEHIELIFGEDLYFYYLCLCNSTKISIVFSEIYLYDIKSETSISKTIGDSGLTTQTRVLVLPTQLLKVYRSLGILENDALNNEQWNKYKHIFKKILKIYIEIVRPFKYKKYLIEIKKHKEYYENISLLNSLKLNFVFITPKNIIYWFLVLKKVIYKIFRINNK